MAASFYIRLSKAILTRQDISGSGVLTSGRELVLANIDKGIKGIIALPPLLNALERSVGSPMAGGFTLPVSIKKFPELKNAPGGYLYDLNYERERVWLDLWILYEDEEVKLPRGVLQTWTLDAKAKLISLQFDIGLAAYSYIDCFTDTRLGAYTLALYTELAALMGLAIGKLEPPNMSLSSPFWSYIAHPERRLAEGQGSYPSQVMYDSTVFCNTGVGYIICIIQQSILSYSIGEHVWHYLGEITHPEYPLRPLKIVSASYTSGTLTTWSRHNPVRPRGTDPSLEQYEQYELTTEVTL
jgi:hypothetical protein